MSGLIERYNLHLKAMELARGNTPTEVMENGLWLMGNAACLSKDLATEILEGGLIGILERLRAANELNSAETACTAANLLLYLAL